MRPPRLFRFLVLASSLTMANVFAYTAATSLFLSHVGAEAIPQFYVLLGILSIPSSVLVSKLIDRVSRVRLLQILLLLGLVVMMGLRGAIALDSAPIYYSIYMTASLLDLLSGILLWTLVSDYFTSLELERHTPLLTMSVTFSGSISGVIVRILSDLVSTRNILFLLPILYGGMIGQLLLLGRAEKPLDLYPLKESEDKLLSSLRAFPKLAWRYPIISLFAGSMVLSVLLWGMSELQFYTVYSNRFPDQGDLTGFLGLLSASLGPLELGVTYFVTRPLLQRWGVSRMNLLYPLTTLLSFVGLATYFRLPCAIAANINYETLYSSIAQPVQNLNYNAIPQRFSGRVRVIIDGLLYPACQALTGGLLIAQQKLLTPLQLSLVGIGLSCVYVGLGHLTGQTYLRAMLSRLQSGLLNLDEVREGLVQIPDAYTDEVRQLLKSEQAEAQELGLELAARLTKPGQFLPEVQMLLLRANSTVRQAVVRFLATNSHPDFYRYLQVQLVDDNPAIREAVLETLIAMRQPLSTVQLMFLLEDPSLPVRSLAFIAAQQSDRQNAEIQAACEATWLTLTTPARPVGITEATIESAQMLVVQAIQESRNSQFIPLLQALIATASDEVKRLGLNTLAVLATPNDYSLATLAMFELESDTAAIRAAALNLLRVVQIDLFLQSIAAMLNDSHPQVRQQAIATIVAYGEACLPVVQPLLNSEHLETEKAAIAAISQLQTRRAETILFEHFQPLYAELARTLHWARQLPPTPAWETIMIALRDDHNQILQRVIYVLSCLEQDRNLTSLASLLTANDRLIRLRAVETLASISRYRRFIQPILPLLEDRIRASENQQTGPTELPLNMTKTLLLEMVDARYRWIRITAIAHLKSHGIPLPLHLVHDPDPFVAKLATLTLSSLRSPTEELNLSRIFFLKQISILQDLPLDDLLTINRTLKEQAFFANELIFRENSWGGDFYFIYKGAVTLLKEVKPEQKGLVPITHTFAGVPQRFLAQLEPGQFFGEMEFFDNLPRSATAIAATDCTLLTLQKYDFQTLLAQRPEIALQMCKVLSMRLRVANEVIDQQKQAATVPDPPTP